MAADQRRHSSHAPWLPAWAIGWPSRASTRVSGSATTGTLPSWRA